MSFLWLAINCIRETRIFPAYCTSLVITLLLHVSGYIDAILSESTTTKIEKNEWIEWEMWWCVLDRPTANPAIKFDTSPSIKNDCILCVHKQQQQQLRVSVQREEREKEFWETNGWLKHQQLFSSIVWKERATPTIIIIMSLYLYLSYPFLSLHCLPI